MNRKITFVDYLNASVPAIFIKTSEISRALNLATRTVFGMGYNTFVWKPGLGLQKISLDDEIISIESQEMITINELLNRNVESKTVYFVFHPRAYFQDSPQGIALTQSLLEAAEKCKRYQSHFIFIGNDSDSFPKEFSDIVKQVDLKYPGNKELKSFIEHTIQSINIIPEGTNDIQKVTVDESEILKAVSILNGVPLVDVEDSIAISIQKTGKLDYNFLMDAKKEKLKGTQVIEVSEPVSINELGGFEVLKEYIEPKKRYFQDPVSAVNYGLESPKGVLLVGLAGTGKSLASKAIAGYLGLPLYRFNLSLVYQGLVGASEKRIKDHLDMLDSLSPCVAEFDEIEKALAGGASSGKTDSGVSSRVIGAVLSWMQETKAPIFKVASANTLNNLDSAILRAGRWDKLFSVDLPEEEDRETIFKIHLKKRKRNPENFNTKLFAEKSSGFCGAEIEACIIDSMFRAFNENREINDNDILKSISIIVPLSVTEKESIDAFRQWVKNRATPVSKNKQTINNNNVKYLRKTEEKGE